MAYKKLLLLAVLLATNPSDLVADEFHIPAMIGQTGSSATFGKGETDAYTLASEEWNARGGINGKKVVLDVEDTRTSQQNIVSGFQLLALKKPAAILGPTWLDGFQGVIPIARRQNILLITPSAAHETFSPENVSWPITFYHNSTIEIKTLLEGLKERGFKSPALIYEQEPFAETITRIVRENGVKLVDERGLQGGTLNLQSIVTSLKLKKPDILIVFVWDESTLFSLLQQLHIQMPGLPIATVHDGEGWLSKQEFMPNISHIIHTKFIIADNSFEERFKKRFGYQPMLTASNAYDAFNSLLSAYAAGKKSQEEVRSYMLTETLDTVTFGKFKFNPDGTLPSRVEIREFTAHRN